MSKDRTRYPRFVRENDVLVRVGWSGHRKREYVIGRTSHYAVEALVSRILDVADPDGNFERKPVVWDLRDPEFGEISPAEAALGLLWLVSSGLVRNSHNSYQINARVDLLNDCARRWDRVPQKKI